MSSWWVGLDRERMRLEVARRHDEHLQRAGMPIGPGVDAPWRFPSRRAHEREIAAFSGLGGFEGRLRSGFRGMGEE